MITTINLADKLALFHSCWDPKIIGEFNGQHLKLAKLAGEFVWHAHAEADELFLVLSGTLEMQLRDRVLQVAPGELVIIPRGVEHCPRAPREVHVLLVEPVGTVNTGTAPGDRTVSDPEWIVPKVRR